MEIPQSKCYMLYDIENKITEFPNDYFICDGNYNFKKQKIHTKKMWYEEYRLCLESVFAVTSNKGKFLSFKLKDYGVIDFKTISFYIKTGDRKKDRYEVCHHLLYDGLDYLNLYYPVDDFNNLNKLELILTSSTFVRGGTRNDISEPKKLTREIKRFFSSIDKTRKKYKTIPRVVNIEEANFSIKLPYKETFISKAWELYPDVVDFLKSLNSVCDELEFLINKLPTSIDNVDIIPPADSDKFIYIPIECTYNQKFFARMYLSRLHKVSSRIVSKFDILQYQIPISISNEPLLLILYGSHWLDPLKTLQDSYILGEDKCNNIYEEAYRNSPILSLIEKIKNNPYMNSMIVKKSYVGERYDRLILCLKNWIEKMTKEAIHKSKILKPSQWKSEYRLYQYIKIFFPDAIYQYRSEWLGSQSLDIYIPSIQCAIEYQGQQHYESLEYFGGDEALISQQNRDMNKAKKCKKQGIKLLEWSYDEKLLFSSVVYFLNDYVYNKVIINNSYIENILKNNLPFPVYDLFLSNTISQIKDEK